MLLLACISLHCTSPLVPDDETKAEFLTWQFGMFLHFNMATFTDREWANGYEDPETFAPGDLDPGQWADAAQAAGMKYAVLTAKHTGGWSLWNSNHTRHDSGAFTNYKNGHGDIIHRFVTAFRDRGIKVGLYYCLPGDYDGKFGNMLPSGSYSMHGLPLEGHADFVSFIKKQLTELLTQYGPIDLIWIDQYRNRYTSKSEWKEIRRHIKSLQPDCFIIANGSRNDSETDIHSYEYPLLIETQPGDALPPADNNSAAEVSDKLGPSWFWNTTQDQGKMKPADEVVTMLRLSNNRHANYLLNVAPDTSGLLPALSVERLHEVGVLLRSNPL